MQKVDNCRRKVRRARVRFEKKLRYWQHRAERDNGDLPFLRKRDITRLQHLEVLVADLRRGGIPRALDRSWKHSQAHL